MSFSFDHTDQLNFINFFSTLKNHKQDDVFARCGNTDFSNESVNRISWRTQLKINSSQTETSKNTRAQHTDGKTAILMPHASIVDERMVTRAVDVIRFNGKNACYFPPFMQILCEPFATCSPV